MRNRVQQLYPSTKIIFLAAAILLNMFMPGYVFQYGFFIAMAVICAFTGDLKKFIGIFLKFILVIVIFIFLFQTCLVRSDDSVQLVGFLYFSQTGLTTSLGLTSKIMAISAVTAWFFQVTSTKDIIYCMEKADVSRKVTFVIASTIQMIPQVKMLQKTIEEAQKSRGIEMEGNFITRMKAFVPMMGPLVLSLLQQSEERVLALESKGFSANVRKTSVYQIKKSGADWILIIIIVAVTVIVFVKGVIL